MNIHVTHLNLDLIEADLPRLFTPYREVKSLELLRDKLNKPSGAGPLICPWNREAKERSICTGWNWQENHYGDGSSLPHRTQMPGLYYKTGHLCPGERQEERCEHLAFDVSRLTMGKPVPIHSLPAGSPHLPRPGNARRF